MTLRLEKGFLHLGSDTDGTTIPDDVGWGKVATAKSADFIGKRSLTLPEHVKPDRLQLVGLTQPQSSRGGKTEAWDATAVNGRRSSGDRDHAPHGANGFAIGSHLRLNDSTNATDGWITSAGIATMTGEPIAMAMLRAGRSHVGSHITVFDDGRPVSQARVVNLPFYDPTGDRMNG